MTNDEYKARFAELEAIGFDGIREKFRKGVQDVKAYSRYLAETALLEFAKSGNLNWLNAFLSDITSVGKNFVRKQAYVAWVVAHAPIKLENDQFIKDRERAESKEVAEWSLLLDKAMQKPFWDFLPEKGFTNFSGIDLIDDLERVLKRYSGAKYIAKDEQTIAVLDEARLKVAELHRVRTRRNPAAAPTEQPAATAEAA